MNVRIFWVHVMECICAQTRPQFIRIRKSFGGIESEPKIPSTGKNSPQRRIKPMTPHQVGQWAQHITELFRSLVILCYAWVQVNQLCGSFRHRNTLFWCFSACLNFGRGGGAFTLISWSECDLGMRKGAKNAQLAVCWSRCPAWCSITGSTLFWASGRKDFSLGVSVGSDSIP